MRKIFIFIIVFSLIGLCSQKVYCESIEEFTEESLEELEDGLRGEDLDRLYDLGVEDAEDISGFSFENLFYVMGEVLRDAYIQPLHILALSVAIIAITGFFKDENEKLCQISAAVSISILIVPNIVNLISNTHMLSHVVGSFLIASIPVYVTLLIASGNTAVGSSYGALSIFGANALVQLTNILFIPSLSALLGISLSSSFSHLSIKSVCESVYKIIKWFMIFCVTVFSGLISVQAAVMGATDVATTKTVKFIASSAIPVVGAAFGDGVAAVQNSIKVLKSGAGAFGMLASISIFIAPVIEILLWIFVTQAILIVADFFKMKNVLDFLSAVQTVIKLVLSINLSICIISIVISAITLFSGA